MTKVPQADEDIVQTTISAPYPSGKTKLSEAHSTTHSTVASPGQPVANVPAGPDRTASQTVEDKEEQAAALRQHDLALTLLFIGIAGLAAGGFAYFEGLSRALEFVAGYVVEYSLSVDNLFVFLLIFNFFRVPRQAQEHVLHYGIIGAVVMRGIMIVLGEELTHHFKLVSVAFAALLLFSAAKLLFGEEEDEEDMNENKVVKFARQLLPFSKTYDGMNFFTEVDGARLATPLMLVLICIELSDVIFALDSVPAVLGISTDTKVVYLSNILAIMGLRNLYFLLSDTLGGLRFLRPSLAIVLGFVGAKMLAGVAGYDVGIVPSLSVVVGTLGGGAVLSYALPAEGTSSQEKSP